MRYRNGSIALSSTRAYPLLRQTLHSGLMSSRNAFNNRVLRLAKHGLLFRHEERSFANHEVVYSISERAASELVGRGECFLWNEHSRDRKARSQLNHASELNEIHLALNRTGTLVHWTPEIEIRSQNNLTAGGYSKHYDAVVLVRLAGVDCKFALEYERTAKLLLRCG